MAATSRAKDEITFLGTGDCGPVHGPKDGFPIERYTELVRPTLAGVDLRFTSGRMPRSMRCGVSRRCPMRRRFRACSSSLDALASLNLN